MSRNSSTPHPNPLPDRGGEGAECPGCGAMLAPGEVCGICAGMARAATAAAERRAKFQPRTPRRATRADWMFEQMRRTAPDLAVGHQEDRRGESVLPESDRTEARTNTDEHGGEA